MHTHHTDDKRKTTRLEVRLTPAISALLRRAAHLHGCSVSNFVASAAQDAAEVTIERRDIIGLSRAGQERFAEALLNPAPLAPAIERAAEAHRQMIRPV